jgi:hypothetical protein
MILRLVGHRERVGYTEVVDGELARCTVVDATDARRDVTCRTRTFADLQSTATPYILFVFTSSRQSAVIYLVCSTANLSAWRHLIMLSAGCEVTRGRLSVRTAVQSRTRLGRGTCYIGELSIPTGALIWPCGKAVQHETSDSHRTPSRRNFWAGKSCGTENLR